MLPGGMNGRQFADEARGLRPGIPVLFTTGYARNAIVHQGRLDPGIDLLVKPFTLARPRRKGSSGTHAVIAVSAPYVCPLTHDTSAAAKLN